MPLDFDPVLIVVIVVMSEGHCWVVESAILNYTSPPFVTTNYYPCTEVKENPRFQEVTELKPQRILMMSLIRLNIFLNSEKHLR